MAPCCCTSWELRSEFVACLLSSLPVPCVLFELPARRFAMYNVVGALIWTVLFCGAGYFFGNLPVVQHNFTLVVLGIVAVSVLPVVLEVRGCLLCVAACSGFVMQR